MRPRILDRIRVAGNDPARFRLRRARGRPVPGALRLLSVHEYCEEPQAARLAAMAAVVDRGIGPCGPGVERTCDALRLALPDRHAYRDRGAASGGVSGAAGLRGDGSVQS